MATQKPSKAEIENLMKSLGISEAEAIDLWKCDNGIEENEEQNALDKSASKVKINKDVGNKNKGVKKEHKVVASEQKQFLYQMLTEMCTTLANTTANFTFNNRTKDKYIDIEYEGQSFTINLVKHNSK